MLRPNVLRAGLVAGTLTVCPYAAAPALAQAPPVPDLRPSAGVPGGVPGAVPPPAAGAVATGSRPRRRTRIALGRRRLDVRLGQRVSVAGRVRPAGRAGLRMRLEVRRGGRWRVLDRARTRAGGRFRVAYRPRSTGSSLVRLRFLGGEGLRPRRRVVGRATAYRVAHASWYGPGLYGNRLGCGGTLTTGSLGVAHKTLPCGSPVSIRHGGRTVRVAVIDRGPYVGGREYDLTAATAEAVGFRGHGPILVTP